MRLPSFASVSLALCGWAASGQAPTPSAAVRSIHAEDASLTGAPTLGVLTVNITANNLTWDPKSQMIYLSVPSVAGPNGNAVQVLNPTTGQLGANVFVGSEPNLLAVSSTGKYLYVGLEGASSVQRMTLPSLGLDVKIALGSDSFSGPFFASDLQASPVADGTMAVVRSVTGESPAEEGGVVIYDDAVARPNVLCGWIQIGCMAATPAPPALYNSIQWNADASVMFAANNEDSGFDFYSVPVTASGFGKVADYGGLTGGYGNQIHFDRVTGYVYDDNGTIIDPVSAETVGRFDTSGLMAPDGALGMAFVVGQQIVNNGSGTYTLTAFDMRRLTPIATATLSNVVGSPNHLIRWGSSGLAFTTTTRGSLSSGSAVYLLSGSFVGPSSPPSIAAGGVAPVGSASSIVQSGEWISIYGGNLASGSAVWDGKFTTSLGGTSVTINGKAAYLSYVSPWQINVQVPDDTATGAVPVVVTTAAGNAPTMTALAPFAPSLPLLDDKHVAAIIIRSNGSGAFGGGSYDVVGPAGTNLGYRTLPAKAGDVVSLFALGLGPTDPAVPAGQPFSGTAQTTNTVTLLVNNVNVPLSFAGLSSASLYQLNFTVPAGLGTGDLPLQVVVAGSQTPSGAVISLQ